MAMDKDFAASAAVAPSTRDVYEAILPEYRKVPRGTGTAEQGIAFLNNPAFYDPSNPNSMVLKNPVIAMNLGVAVCERVAAGVERQKVVETLNAHPVVSALEEFAPKEAAYYKQVRLNMAAGTVDPVRAAWQNEAWGPYNKLVNDRKAAGNPLTDDERTEALRVVYEHPTRAPLKGGSAYDAVDVLASIADQLPRDRASVFVQKCILPSEEFAMLHSDTPATANYFGQYLMGKFMTPKVAPAPAADTPPPPAAA